MMHARFHLKCGLRGLAALWLLACPGICLAQTPQERAVVDTFLKEWHRTNLIVDTEFDRLMPLGKQALPLLAEYLFSAIPAARWNPNREPW